MKLSFVEAFAFDRHERHRQARRVEFQHHRRQSSRRQPFQVGKRQVRYLGDVRIGAGPRLKRDPYHTDAEQRTGLEVIDSAGESEEPLQRVGDVGFDILWRHSREEGGDHHLWNVNRGEKIHRHALNAQYSEQEQRETDDHDKVGIAYRKSRHERLSTPGLTNKPIGFEFCIRSFLRHEVARACRLSKRRDR